MTFRRREQRVGFTEPDLGQPAPGNLRLYGVRIMEYFSACSAVDDGIALRATVALQAGDRRCLSLTYTRRDIAAVAPLSRAADDRLQATLRWWRAWADSCRFQGPYRPVLVRSALALKLMTYDLSGAVVAAATAGLTVWRKESLFARTSEKVRRVRDVPLGRLEWALLALGVVLLVVAPAFAARVTTLGTTKAVRSASGSSWTAERSAGDTFERDGAVDDPPRSPDPGPRVPFAPPRGRGVHDLRLLEA